MPVKPSSHENLLRLTLMIAGCFAVGSVGLLMATILHQGASAGAGKAEVLAAEADTQKKQALIADLNTATTSSAGGTAAVATAPGPATSSVPLPKQPADTSLKMKLLQSLNTK